MHAPASSRLRIGILGTARIARAFATDLDPSDTVEVTAVASRDVAKAAQFAHEFKIPAAYGSYEELLDDGAVDAVYVPLPNGLHAAWSIRAVEAGKHVLCEKPLAATAADVTAMFEAARRRSVTLVEGFPYRSQPQTLKLKALVESGAIGRLISMHAAFGFTLADSGNIRLDPALAGGALMDVGTYPVSLVRLLAGERPSRVYTSARWHSSGVDETLIASLEHRSGFLAQISCSFATALHRQALIAGSAGMLQSTYWNTPPPDRPVVVQLKRGIGADSAFEDIEVPALNGFRAEAESFALAIRLGPGHWKGATPDESLDIAATLEAILHSARTGAPVDLAG
jgi:predicted dehydrogenase